MRRVQTTYRTGRTESELVEHVRVQWLETYAGREYVVQEQIDPPSQPSAIPGEPATVLYNPNPSMTAVLASLATQDLAAAQAARVPGLQRAWADALTLDAKVGVIGRYLNLAP